MEERGRERRSCTFAGWKKVLKRGSVVYVNQSKSARLLGWSIRDRSISSPDYYRGLPDHNWPHHTTEWCPWLQMTQNSDKLLDDLREFKAETMVLLEIEIDQFDRFGEDFQDLRESNPDVYGSTPFKLYFPELQALDASNRTFLGFDVVNCELERRRPDISSLGFLPKSGVAEYDLLRTKDDAQQFASWLCVNYLDCEENPLHLLNWYLYSPEVIKLLIENGGLGGHPGSK